MVNRTQRTKKLGNKDLGLAETQRREAIIKDSLSRTKNVSPNMRTADEIERGGFTALEEREKERLLEQQKIDFQNQLLNTPPPQQQPSQAPSQSTELMPQKLSSPSPTASLKGPFNPDEAINLAGATAGGVAGAAAGATTGAGIGAGVGALFGGVGAAPGALAGGIIGGAAGFIGGFTAKLVSDRRQATKEAYKTFTVSSGSRYQEILNAANDPSIPRDVVLQKYRENQQNIYLARDKARALTKSAIGRQLSGAQDELIAIELWLEDEDLREIDFLNQLQSPDPSRIKLLPREENNG